MTSRRRWTKLAALSPIVLSALLASPASSQAPPQIVSPEVGPDGRVTFRIAAPMARTVAVRGEFGSPVALVRGERGEWTGALEGARPGTYRYTFLVDSVTTLDSRNPLTSAANANVQSLLHLPGSEWQDAKPVPHGAVAEVYYDSRALGLPRRMHVYTPPGYEAGTDRLPVMYLLHGGGDSDDSWTTVGRANVILDNLLAAGRIRPMIVVMPAGHTPRGGNAMSADASQDPFTADLLDDVIPLVERTYRALPGRESRAIVGLSMGGVQTLNVGLGHLDRFSHVGVFSSGWFPEVRAAWETANRATLTDPRTNERLRLLWIAAGKDDIANANSKAMNAMFDRYGIRYRWTESEGGHTWTNWRDYLTEIAPLLFR